MENKWFLMQEFPRATYFNWAMAMRNASLGWKEEFGITDSLTVFHEGSLELHFHQAKWRKLGEAALKKILSDLPWFEDIIQNTYELIDAFFHFLDELRDLNFKLLTNAELAKQIAKYENLRQRTHLYGVIGTILEFDHELLTKYLKDYLSKKSNDKSVSEIFSLLTTFHKDTYVRKEEKDMLSLVKEVLKLPESTSFMEEENLNASSLQKCYPIIATLLKLHYIKYCWIPYQYVGPAWTEEYFIETLQGLLKQRIKSDKLLKDFEDHHKRTEIAQKEIEKKLNVDPYHRQLFYLSRELAYIKSLRNDSFIFGFYCTEPLLKEIGRRLCFSLEDMRCFLPSEIESALNGKKYSKENLKRRWKFSAYVILDGGESFLIGDKARKLVEKIREKEPKIVEKKELRGTVAVVGKVQGTVKIILDVGDMKKMNKGDILVSNATYPSLVPAMKKAGAIVTDLGGITCHAAIISREFHIPCIVGTKIATQILHDGDAVEVDATNGIVKKIK